ncbi:MAG: cytochrome c bioproteinis protein [Parcubacteria group bacterium Gr01-1014_30]|nr:MAG: cytochrome c bioproteinis protein [Parcubacteria group bacterium Gr01-1014_30]
MATQISIGIAFIAGLVSFISPCVLPIIPGFLAYLSGGVTTGEKSRGRVFGAALLFVLGFTLVFAALGVLLNTLLSRVAYDAQIWLARIGGTIIIFFGLYLTRLFSIPYLERAHTFGVSEKLSSRLKGQFGRNVTSLLFGAAFAAGWTPCVGAALGAILGLAASAPSAAFWLLLSYSLGLGVPFLVIGAFTAQVQKYLAKFNRAAKYITVVFGVILIILGVLVFTQKLAVLANFGLLEKLLGQ